MDAPAVKGSAFQSVVEDVKRLIDEGRISPEELGEQLTDKDRGLLDALITPVTWVPMDSYGRMLELLAQEEGGANPTAYLRARGARAAERLLSGNYAVFNAEPGTWGPRVGQMMVTLATLLYNFTEWTFRRVEEDVYDIDCRGAAGYPEPARLSAEGFLGWFAEHAAGRPMRVASRRPEPDLIVFRVEQR